MLPVLAEKPVVLAMKCTSHNSGQRILCLSLKMLLVGLMHVILLTGLYYGRVKDHLAVLDSDLLVFLFAVARSVWCLLLPNLA